jgi:hypothetical protein
LKGERTPFTPLHLGPALAIGLPLKRYLHVPTFIVANVVLDVEGFLVLFLRLRYPLHGFLHTLLLATVVGLFLGYVMFKLERRLQPVYKSLLLETDLPYTSKSFLAAGVGGAALHVLFDAPLYTDVHPLFPYPSNPLLGAFSASSIYNLCLSLGIFALAFYVVSIVFQLHKKFSAEKQP